MLYIFHGTDSITITRKARELVDGLIAKRPDALVFRFEEGDAEGRMHALIGAAGLFTPRHVVYARGVLADAEVRSALLGRVEEMAHSENIFILAEAALDAATVRTLTPHATRITAFAKKAASKDIYNVFSIADALCGRDRKALWVGYTRALREGIAPEAIHGTLFWGVKQMLLAQNSTSAEEAGQKAHVYAKYRRYAALYAPGEVGALSRELVGLTHESHRRSLELATELERWLLSR